MWAASKGNADASDVLIESGAEVGARSKAGWTSFLFAVRNDHVEAANVLLNHGANVDDVSPDGTSALNMAVVNAYFELAAVLLDHGADPNASDPRGSALHTLAWLRKPGADGAAGVGNTPHGPPVPTKLTAIELAKKLPSRANPIRISWEEEVRQGRRHDEERRSSNSDGLPVCRRHARLCGRAQGDAPYLRLLADHGADRRCRCAESPRSSPHRSRLLGRRGPDHSPAAPRPNDWSGKPH